MPRQFQLQCQLQGESLEARIALAADALHLVLVTHGWNGQASGWPTAIRDNIAAQVEIHRAAEAVDIHELSWSEQQGELPHPMNVDDVDELWEIAAFDWSDSADTFFPTSAADNAAEIGNRIGTQLAARDYDSMHVIGHSAGSWLINAMLNQVEASSPGTQTQATFLDAYTPTAESSMTFGSTADWAEHYVHDGVLPSTNEQFDSAWNIDLTRIGPSGFDDLIGFGVPGHAWPWEWYLETTRRPFASDAHGLGFVRSPAMTSDIPSADLRGSTLLVALPGDANDDGRFESSDLIQIFQSGKYDSGQSADWQDGDWNDDGVFDSGDLVIAFRSGTYVNAAVSFNVADLGLADFGHRADLDNNDKHDDKRPQVKIGDDIDWDELKG